MLFILKLLYIMQITGSELARLIKESIQQEVRNYLIKEAAKKRVLKMLKEEFENWGNYYQYEEEGEDVGRKSKESQNLDDERLADIHSETSSEKKVRSQVENFFKQPGVDNAPYAYKLYNVRPEKGKDTNDMKNARKKFADNVNHATNQNGYAYTFTSAEINRLQSMISNSELQEQSFRKTKKEIEEIARERAGR